jgi:hypothetical protein
MSVWTYTVFEACNRGSGRLKQLVKTHLICSKNGKTKYMRYMVNQIITKLFIFEDLSFTAGVNHFVFYATEKFGSLIANNAGNKNHFILFLHIFFNVGK